MFLHKCSQMLSLEPKQTYTECAQQPQTWLQVYGLTVTEDHQ